MGNNKAEYDVTRKRGTAGRFDAIPSKNRFPYFQKNNKK